MSGADLRYGVEMTVSWHPRTGWHWRLVAVSAVPGAPAEDWSGLVSSPDEAWKRARAKAVELGFSPEEGK